MDSNYFTPDQHILDKLKGAKMKFLDDKVLCMRNVSSKDSDFVCVFQGVSPNTFESHIIAI